MMLLLNYVVCSNKKSRFIKEQETKGLLSSLGITTSLIKAPLFSPIIFQTYKMNEVISTYLLAGDKFMSQMHLKQPGITYRA